jgi:hypothetical protein
MLKRISHLWIADSKQAAGRNCETVNKICLNRIVLQKQVGTHGEIAKKKKKGLKIGSKAHLGKLKLIYRNLNQRLAVVRPQLPGLDMSQSWIQALWWKYLDLYSVIVFGANPVHSTRMACIFDHFGGHHRTAALGTHMRMNCAFVSHTRSRCFRNLLFLCHL